MVKKHTKTNTSIIGKLVLHDINGKEHGSIQLNKDIFDGSVNKSVIYQSVVMYHANARQGTASTKTREFVSGGGKKPWRQKGTGRARVGSIRNPIWRGGGVVFGPHPRSYYYSLPKKILRNALLSVINSRLNDEKVIVIDTLNFEKPKTKSASDFLSKLKVNEKCLIVLGKIPANVRLSFRNIKTATLMLADNITSLDVLSHNVLLLDKDSISVLEKRLKNE